MTGGRFLTLHRIHFDSCWLQLGSVSTHISLVIHFARGQSAARQNNVFSCFTLCTGWHFSLLSFFTVDFVPDVRWGHKATVFSVSLLSPTTDILLRCSVLFALFSPSLFSLPCSPSHGTVVKVLIGAVQSWQRSDQNVKRHPRKRPVSRWCF